MESMKASVIKVDSNNINPIVSLFLKSRKDATTEETSVNISDNFNRVDCKAGAFADNKTVITRAAKLRSTTNNDHRNVARGTSWYSEGLVSTILLI